MISVQEAQNIIQSHPDSFSSESVTFDQSIGRVLLEDIYAEAVPFL